ncbi:hypothetical protein ACHQM5_009226 [Ranunculus cassubicifolius]
MSSNRKTANALGGKTARACDSCMRKRARWYCTADDAFLCQGCDASVHSANPLARRHERVRLKTASAAVTSLKLATEESSIENSLPAWHQGFRRKPRTPRHGKHNNLSKESTASKTEEPEAVSHSCLPLVPEIGSDEVSFDENEEHLLYRVPIFDPFVAEIYAATTPNADTPTPTTSTPPSTESKIAIQDYGNQDGCIDFENLHGLPSDMDLAEFAADVETLLGRGLDEDSFGMEGLGLLDTKEEIYYDHEGKVKVEDEDEDVKNMVGCHFGSDIDLSRETLDLNFDCDSPTTGEEEEEKVNMSMMSMKTEEKMSLRLNYDAVINAWKGSPWMAGDRPRFNPDDCWPDSLGTCVTGEGHQNMYAEMGNMGGHVGMGGDGGREARVSRYREKRRTRLFSKKIRYEVRKLNAEKRPRMKGRFVKRASFAVGGPSSNSFPF